MTRRTFLQRIQRIQRIQRGPRPREQHLSAQRLELLLRARVLRLEVRVLRAWPRRACQQEGRRSCFSPSSYREQGSAGSSIQGDLGPFPLTRPRVQTWPRLPRGRSRPARGGHGRDLGSERSAAGLELLVRSCQELQLLGCGRCLRRRAQGEGPGRAAGLAWPPRAVKDAACPISTGRGTRRVQLVRRTGGGLSLFAAHG
jgi:hypothetical protein